MTMIHLHMRYCQRAFSLCRYDKQVVCNTPLTINPQKSFGSVRRGGLHPPYKQAMRKKIVRNDVLYKIFTDAIESGPLDGGCYAMAKALQNILGGELYSLSGINLQGERQAEHVVLKSGAPRADGAYLPTSGSRI